MRRLTKVSLVVAAAAALAPGAASAWTWPVEGPVLRPFSLGSDPYAGGQHRVIDIGAASGNSVAAPTSGTVTFAGTVPTSGKSVTIRTADGLNVTLTHLGSIGVARNAAVVEGQPVGTVGPSGTVDLDVPYLSLGVRVTSNPNGYLDPLGFLPAPPAAAPGPVLAPLPEPTPVRVEPPVATAPPPPQAVAPAPVAAPELVVALLPVAASQPVVVPLPVAAPEPVAAPQPASSPVLAVAPAPVVAPEPVAAPEAVPTPVLVASPEPVAAPQPVASSPPVTERAVEREPLEAARPAQQPVASPPPAPAPDEEPTTEPATLTPGPVGVAESLAALEVAAASGGDPAVEPAGSSGESGRGQPDEVAVTAATFPSATPAVAPAAVTAPTATAASPVAPAPGTTIASGQYGGATPALAAALAPAAANATPAQPSAVAGQRHRTHPRAAELAVLALAGLGLGGLLVARPRGTVGVATGHTAPVPPPRYQRAPRTRTHAGPERRPSRHATAARPGRQLARR